MFIDSDSFSLAIAPLVAKRLNFNVPLLKELLDFCISWFYKHIARDGATDVVPNYF